MHVGNLLPVLKIYNIRNVDYRFPVLAVNFGNVRFVRVVISQHAPIAPIHSICDVDYRLERIGANKSMQCEQTST